MEQAVPMQMDRAGGGHQSLTDKKNLYVKVRLHAHLCSICSVIASFSSFYCTFCIYYSKLKRDGFRRCVAAMPTRSSKLPLLKIRTKIFTMRLRRLGAAFAFSARATDLLRSTCTVAIMMQLHKS